MLTSENNNVELAEYVVVEGLVYSAERNNPKNVKETGLCDIKLSRRSLVYKRLLMIICNRGMETVGRRGRLCVAPCTLRMPLNK